MSERICVLLADDHPALRVGLRVLLEQSPGICVVGEVGDGQEALAQMEALRPDVIVLDCQLPGMDGVAVAVEVRRRGLPSRVLALSSYTDAQYMHGMLEAGALGYLSKEEAPGGIVAAVRAAATGKSLWTAEQLMRVRRWQEEVKARWERLTEREGEVLTLVAQSKSNQEIAALLCVTEKTVEKHLSNVLDKLGLISRTEAALWAVTTGLVSV